MAPAPASQRSKTKRTNSRPCDACAIRRVRCDIQTRPDGVCSNCKNHEVQCTNVRIRHKSGPKKIKQKTRDSIISLISNSTSASQENGQPQTFTLNQLLPFLQIYQTWYYCIWPILSVAHLTSRLNAKFEYTDEPLNFTGDVAMAEQYALACSVCAVISRHRQFMKSAGDSVNLSNYPSPQQYASEARRVIYEFELRASPTMEVLLTNYFLHTYFCNIPGGAQRGLVYLREAISIAHVLKLHDPTTYIGKSGAETHRYRKIYYQLLVTERFVAFECGIPVLLEPTVPTPSMEDEEYPDLLLGFTELVQVFALTDKMFFQELQTKVLTNTRNEHTTMFQYSNISVLQEFLQSQPSAVKRQWISQLQKKLDRRIEHEQVLMDSQKVNIKVSKVWFQSIAWLISSENLLINTNTNTPINDCFSAKYPMKITNEFLTATTGLPDFAFESNGPGVAMKLLEVVDSLYSFTMMSTNESDCTLAYDQMNTVFNMIVRFKNDMDLPHNVFNKIANALNSRKSMSITELSSSPNSSPDSLELFDDHESTGELDTKDDNNDLLKSIVDGPTIEDPMVTVTGNELVRDLSSSNLKALLNTLDTPNSMMGGFSFSPFLQQMPTNFSSPVGYQTNGLTSQDF